MNPQTRARLIRPSSLVSMALLFALSLTGCAEEAEPDTDDAAAQTAANQAVEANGDETANGDTSGGEVMTFEEVSDDLGAHVGDTITVRAKVDDVMTPEVFTITREDGMTIEPIIVVDAEASEELEVGSTIEVTGLVQSEFLVAETEKTLDIQLDDELLAECENRPFIEATNVDTSANS